MKEEDVSRELREREGEERKEQTGGRERGTKKSRFRREKIS